MTEPKTRPYGQDDAAAAPVEEVSTADMHYPMQCKWCGCIHDTGKVAVVARYTDCSVWKCPRCGVSLDDRPGGWGGAYKVDRRTGQVTR